MTVPAAGRLQLTNGSSTKRRPRSLIVNRTVRTTGARTVTITVKPTARALKALRASRRSGRVGALRITVAGTFTARSGEVLRDQRSYTLRLR